MEKVRHAGCSSRTRLWVCFLIASLSACRMNGVPAPATATVEVTELSRSSHCLNDNAEPSVAWISGNAAYLSAYNRTRKPAPGDKGSPPGVDFNHTGVVAVYMGRYSTAGYRLSLASGAAEVGEKNELTLRVAWDVPPEGALLAQVITSPCMLVSIPGNRYSKINVVDQDGRLRASQDLSIGSGN